MYTEHLTQRLGITAPVVPQTLTSTTTVNSGKVDLSVFRRALFLFETGAFGGTSPTLSAVLQIQDSPDGTTWTNNATVPSATVTAASKQATLEIRADQLNSGERYVRLQAVCTIGGTSPTIPVAIVGFGDEAAHKPGNPRTMPASSVKPSSIDSPVLPTRSVSKGVSAGSTGWQRSRRYNMAAKDLITLARAKQDIQSITDTSQDTLLAALITAYSDAIEKYCRRRFVSQSYDELYNGNGDRRLLLREYPIQSVQSVRYRPVTVLKIINNNTAAIQRTTVQVTSTGITLISVASGADQHRYEQHLREFPTLQGIANNINGLGNGWSAQAVGLSTEDYGLFPSADLYVPSSYGDGTTTASQGR